MLPFASGFKSGPRRKCMEKKETQFTMSHLDVVKGLEEWSTEKLGFREEA